MEVETEVRVGEQRENKSFFLRLKAGPDKKLRTESKAEAEKVSSSDSSSLMIPIFLIDPNVAVPTKTVAVQSSVV